MQTLVTSLVCEGAFEEIPAFQLARIERRVRAERLTMRQVNGEPDVIRTVRSAGYSLDTASLKQ